MKPIRFHDFRRTYATLAIAQGLDIRLVTERLGHAHPSITLDVYAHVLNDQRKRAAISLDGLLGAAASAATGAATGGDTRILTGEKAG
ncbi:tyrosine-type recombinase/integrase [Deinococcus radiomollis]|uniref:tyrosine-type recombinase/integrase n=1 Tax=Deinococcus radiomollis TaxID=468916 RepID=UPI0038913D3F